MAKDKWQKAKGRWQKANVRRQDLRDRLNPAHAFISGSAIQNPESKIQNV
jgi:hypothetical protein